MYLITNISDVIFDSDIDFMTKPIYYYTYLCIYIICLYLCMSVYLMSYRYMYLMLYLSVIVLLYAYISNVISVSNSEIVCIYVIYVCISDVIYFCVSDVHNSHRYIGGLV